jgi:hypothetical protein
LSPLFTAAALARLDGSEADGIHLLWTAPAGAGYSLDGWDIQRRKAHGRPKVDCYRLTAAELELLHRVLRLHTPVAEIAARQAACPEFPTLSPDEGLGDAGPPARTRVVFGDLEAGRGPNPRAVGDLVVETRDATGGAAASTTVRSVGELRGIDCGFETLVTLPGPARSVELTLAHFSKPAEVEAFEADGRSAGVARMSAGPGQSETLRLAGSALARVAIRPAALDTLLLQLDYEPRVAAVEHPGAGEAGLRSLLPTLEPLPPGGTPFAIGTAPGRRCGAYDIRLREGHRVVEIRAGVPWALAIALRDSKAVAARMLVAAAGTQSTRFENLDVDQVVIYCGARASLLDVCLDAVAEQEEQAWAGSRLIAKGIQVPIRALDPALGSQADEDALARSRLLAGEVFDEDAFHDVAELMNAAAADAASAAPVWASVTEREELGDPFIELRPWSYALAVLVEPAWRRMLGFGFLDGAEALEPGAAYDYRITGRFRRRDVEERLHGFHTVPRGTTLPTAFALGPVSLLTPEPVTVRQLPEPAEDAFSATGRKGVPLAGEPCLTLTFPVPVTRVVLELAPGSSLRWKASTTDFLPGLSISSFGGDLPDERRVTIETPDPVDKITLSGSGFLFGVRELWSPPGADPDDLLTRSVVLYGVVFADTPTPDPPPFIGTLNLQQPSLPTDPASGPPPAPASLGFRLNWLPPPPAGAAAPVPWPTDLAAFPPFDVLGFRIERRRVDDGGQFESLDGAGLSTLVLGSRGGQRDPPPLGVGVDLEAVFPDVPAPSPPLSPLMSLDDVLVNADHEGPPPGSTHQYRIFSVDAIGRPSASARVGSVVRLEKRQPPPQPVASPEPPPAGAIVPSGVRARVLQADDPNLVADDQTLLGSSTNAVVLEWGWTRAERDADPHATEFRVYWQSLAPDLVRGAVTAPPSVVNGLFELPATLDRPLAADVMRGRYLALPDYPFKVSAHTAGQSVVLQLEPSVIEPARTPAPAAFEFRPVLNGAEQRPPAWAERSAVVPLTDAESYRHVFRDALVLDADHPRARVWTGVSAADDQPYVADALPTAVPNGGRPGNESAIVATAATARYLGRPDLTVPPPLPDVPELVTDEPAGEAVTVRVDLPTLLAGVAVPGGHLIQFERIGLDRIVACMSARTDDTIGATLPDSTTTSYTQPNPDDQAALLAEIRTGTPARVEGRFLMDFLVRFGAELESQWVAALPGPVEFGALTDTLPHKAERYVHRMRLVDAAGHVSAGAAIAPQIVRVPSLRLPGPPRLTAPPSATDTLALEVRVRDAFDLAWVVLFTEVEDAAGAPSDNLQRPARLLRLPNRRDLYPDEGIRVRLADGTLLAPAAVLEVGNGAVDVPDRVLSSTLMPGHGRRAAVWSVAMTRDGVPSRLAGPVVALTGPPPLVAPQLTVTSADGSDSVQWTALSEPALLSLERSSDAGATWRQVSPWLPDGVTSYTVPSTPGAVRYRARLRAAQGRRATGPEAAPS